MTYTQKLRFLLRTVSKRKIVTLIVLLFIGLIFEMASIGLLIPVLSLMLNSQNLGKQYPVLQPYLQALGNPTQIQLVSWGMGILILFYLVKAVFLVFLSWKQGKITSGLSVVLSRNLFEGYLNQPYMFHLQRNSAELFRNINSEISQFTSVVYNFLTIILEFSVVFGIIAILIYKEPIGAVCVSSIIFLFALLFHRVTKNKLTLWGDKRQFHTNLYYKHLLQGLAGAKDVKLLGRESFFLNEFNFHNYILAEVNMKNATLGFVPRLYFEFLAVFGLAGIVIIMVLQNKPMDLFIPTIGMFVTAAFRMIPSVTRILTATQQIKMCKNSVELLYAEFKSIENIERHSSCTTGLVFRDKIELSGIHFQYTNSHSKVIEELTLKIARGESVGFIGPSGSGKSTLIDIILGLLPPEKGRVSIDGQDIQKNLRGWQDQIGYVPQTIYLTDDTLLHNVAFGISYNKIDYDAVERAIKAAQLDEFIKNLPDGLETFVGERGIRLSGGQRQRIGIARALYHDPRVLVLDEATSSLDSATEQGVMQAVNALQGNKTLIIVAHRLSTVENCNKIYKLNNGKLVAEGTPEEMLVLTKIK